MPIYNGEEFMKESIPTVIYQTYKEWELIIGINLTADAFAKALGIDRSTKAPV